MVEACSGFHELLARDPKPSYSYILADLANSQEALTDRVRRLATHFPRTRLVILDDGLGIRTAVEAVKAGAYDYLAKPFSPAQLLEIIGQGGEGTGDSLPGLHFSFGTIVGSSPRIMQVFELISKVAGTDSTVLITGDSGTGKELIARAIHLESARAGRPLVPVNCGAIPEELLESELFGHEKGAFTSAIRTRIGRFELAEGGTVFLDEIGEMSPQLQVKLLRVLQERQFERVGGTRTITADIRVVTATNQNLKEAVKEGRFREDLYYRLDVIPILAPPLRERREDIPLLVKYFLDRFNQARPSGVTGIGRAALEVLTAYDWPGNVRELENLVERMVILSDGPLIGLKDLPERFSGRRSAPLSGGPTLPADGFNLNRHLAQVEEDLIRQALEKAGGVKKRAADLLGLNRTTLVEKMKKKGIQ